MFPNFRLMIAAVAASVVALSCGFGVFAALRVNHEPLARLPAATAPLQLVPDKVAGPALLSASPSPVGEPEIAAAAPDVPAGESARHESDQTPSARFGRRAGSCRIHCGSEDGDRGAAGRPAG